MDQIKIGKYIAEKRKSLSLTQAQLAEQLGMSDKSVSKWERGVCLPDVSVYKPLCDALGISLNEFLAGEDIPEEAAVSKSENTLIQIIREHKGDKKKMRRIIAVLTAVVLIVSSIMIHMLIKDGKFMLNYITLLASGSPEIVIAEMVAGSDVYLYEYSVEDKYNNVKVNLHTYKNGKFISSENILDAAFYDEYSGDGMIAISTNDDNYSVRSIVSAAGFSVSSDNKLLNKEIHGDWFATSVDRPDEETRIDVSAETGILALTYDFDAISSSVSVDIQEDGFWPKGQEFVEQLKENDYTFFFTVDFGTVDYPERVSADEE